MLSRIDMLYGDFNQIEAPRVPGRNTHPLISILLLVAAAAIADADGLVGVKCLGIKCLGIVRLDWFSHFNRAPQRHPLAQHHRPSTATDQARAVSANTIHFPHAWAARHEATLGQAEVGSRTNEITAIHELLGFIDVRGTIISLDAIGAQKSITEKVHSNDGDCILASKDNCPG